MATPAAMLAALPREIWQMMDRTHVQRLLTTALPSDLPATIRQTKARLRDQVGDVARALAEVGAAVHTEVAAVVAEREVGDEVFPTVRFADVAAGAVPAATVASIRRRGCAVVKGTFP